jgi:DNA-binding transcriptional LysR family regulator
MTDVDWQLYRSFLAVVRTGSLSAAARRLGLTQPTIGRQIAELEQALGLALFTRSPQGLVPTEASATLLPHAEAMESAAQALARAASGASDETKGTIRLTASDIMSGEVLPPILAAFQDQHRGIAIELVASNRIEDLLRRDADIAIRMARPTQEALVARRMGAVPIYLYAHRRYLARRPMPLRIEDLFGHTMIGIDRDETAVRGLEIANYRITRETFSFRTDNDLVQIAAIRAGGGVGGMQAGIARRDPDLVAVLPDLIRFELEMWLVMHEDQRMDRRVRLLYDHLAVALEQYVAACN